VSPNRIGHYCNSRVKRVPEQARAAVFVSRQALRVILNERSDLTKLKDGAARSMEVMLNAHPEPL